MKHGIRCFYWGKGADTPIEYYIDKVAGLGFDIVELESGMIIDKNDQQLTNLKQYAQDKGIGLTIGGGSARRLSLCDPDESIRNAGIVWRSKLIKNMHKAGIRIVCGPMHAYWPVNFDEGPVDKQADWERSVDSLNKLSKVSEENDVLLCVEVLNRFENHILNTAEEGTRFVKDVGSSHVKLLLDTFHMNIEEDSLAAAIRTAGSALGHFHIGESNRRLPGKGHLPWREICEALVDIDYDGAAVMEPFVRVPEAAKQVCRIWRPMFDGGEDKLDQDAAGALQFFRNVYDNAKESYIRLSRQY